MLAGSAGGSSDKSRPSPENFATHPDQVDDLADPNVEDLAQQLGSVLTSTFGVVNRKFTAIEKKSDLLSRDVDDELEKQKSSIQTLFNDYAGLRDNIAESMQLMKDFESRFQSLAETVQATKSHIVETEKPNTVPITTPPAASSIDPSPLIERIASLETMMNEQMVTNNILRDRIAELESTRNAVTGDGTVTFDEKLLRDLVEKETKKQIAGVEITAPDNSEIEAIQKEFLSKIEDIEVKLDSLHVSIQGMESRKVEEDAKRDEVSSEIESLQNSVSAISGVFTQFNELSELVGDLRESVKSSLGFSAAIKRLQLNMNDVIADIDELKYKHSLPQNSSNAQQGIRTIEEVSNFKNTLIEGEIEALKTKLLELRDDLDAGLDAFADLHAGDPEGSEALDSPFIAKVAEFADHLDTVLPACSMKDTVDATLAALFEPLDSLTLEMENLFQIDKAASATMGITFDDLNIEGVSTNKAKKSIRENLMKVYKASLPILDYRIDKITMRRRLERIEGSIDVKADSASMIAMEQQLRHLVNAKADQSELHSIASKKVSIGELQRLKDQLMKQIVGLKGSDHDSSGNRPDSMSAALVNERTAGLAEELKKLARRFDILHNLQEDLITQCDKLVPREEVEQALRALLNELKLMKSNSVSPDALRESLQAKANAAEVQKLVAALTGALGDLVGKTDVASAVHARCLVCDKPVRSIALDPISSSNKRTTSPEKLGEPFGGGFYSKIHDKGVDNKRQQKMFETSGALNSQSLLSSWASPPRSSTRPETLAITMNTSASNDFSAVDISEPSPSKTKISTDFAIVRSSVDLPPIEPQTSGKGSADAVKQRIRVSAGGGTGPNYTQDTR